MIALLVITDGRDHIHTAIPSALAHLDGDIGYRVIYDDSGDFDNMGKLSETFGPLGFYVIGGDERRGFGGAIDYAWKHLWWVDDSPFVFHMEDDFTFNRPVNLAAMAQVLTEHPKLAQMALRRQPWNAEERAAGGIVEQHPDDFIDQSDRFGNEWLEHRRFFTTNPCLYRRELMDGGWPQVEHSEGAMTHLLRECGRTFGYWGARHSGEWVTHIGTERVGVGY